MLTWPSPVRVEHECHEAMMTVTERQTAHEMLNLTAPWHLFSMACSGIIVRGSECGPDAFALFALCTFNRFFIFGLEVIGFGTTLGVN